MAKDLQSWSHGKENVQETVGTSKWTYVLYIWLSIHCHIVITARKLYVPSLLSTAANWKAIIPLQADPSKSAPLEGCAHGVVNTNQLCGEDFFSLKTFWAAVPLAQLAADSIQFFSLPVLWPECWPSGNLLNQEVLQFIRWVEGDWNTPTHSAMGRHIPRVLRHAAIDYMCTFYYAIVFTTLIHTNV